MSADLNGLAIGVIGAGAWGTALAQMLASDGRAWRCGRASRTCRHDQRHAPQSHLSARRHAGQTITATSDLAAMAALPVLLWVTPRNSSAACWRACRITPAIWCSAPRASRRAPGG
jgi:glycerol-3-phosphate dehydrogenase